MAKPGQLEELGQRRERVGADSALREKACHVFEWRLDFPPRPTLGRQYPFHRRVGGNYGTTWVRLQPRVAQARSDRRRQSARLPQYLGVFIWRRHRSTVRSESTEDRDERHDGENDRDQDLPPAEPEIGNHLFSQTVAAGRRAKVPNRRQLE